MRLRAVLAGLLALPALASEPPLAATCPTHFALQDGVCELVTPYRRFGSLQNQGLGGLKIGLPPLRSGFTPQQIDLGRRLFFDPVLSVDGKMACASCHDPAKGFSDGLARSLGMDGKPLLRNAPTLWNVGFAQSLFWDGRARTLEAQMLGPLYDKTEMANPSPEALRQRLQASGAYPALFKQAYGEAQVTLPALYRSLVAFQSTLVSLNSRYDLYAMGVPKALNAREVAGLNVFRSFVARCAECHTPPLFTNQQIAVIGGPELSGAPWDDGAFTTNGEPTLRGGFKVPTLRNITLTAPYGHNGALPELRGATAFYNQGRGHAVPKNRKLLLHWHIWNPQLSAREIDDLVAFMGALTDESARPAVPTTLPSGLQPVVH